MITNQKPYKMINGFTRPKHPFQIFIIIFFIQLLVCVSVAIMPITNIIVQIILAIIFYFLAVMIFYYAFLTSYIDPTDDRIIQSRRAQNIEMEQELYDYFCSFCDSYVSGSTKHCRVCERCVSDFDHHCKWLNNCVGKKNYQQFFKLLICVSIFGIIFIIFSVFSFLFQKPNILIWIWINVALVALLFILNFNLMIFHFWLKFKGISTYEYIIKRRQKNSMQQVPIETPQKFCCSTKMSRKINPQVEVMTQHEEQIQKIENQQIEPQSETKQPNIEIDGEGEGESVQANEQAKRKNSSHTLNSQFKSQGQE